MKRLSEFQQRSIRVVLTDIDGTLTDKHGRLPPHSYERLWSLQRAGFQVIPVTGRPAGWCELIARLWPVHGVVGENGAFYFSLRDGKMRRRFMRSIDQRKSDRLGLKSIRAEVLQKFPASRVSSDQFSRLFDLAIDFSEDVAPLPMTDVEGIAEIFRQHGAQAKISNIHVNGWYGKYDKLSTCKQYLRREFAMQDAEIKERCIFIGDSPNDEPMFGHFPYAFAVSNISEFLPQLKHRPAFVADQAEADGFCQIADRILALSGR
jgi:HAD superfamily hydrolase (TIGR01484 family)